MSGFMAVIDAFKAELIAVTTPSREAITIVASMAYELAPIAPCVVTEVCGFMRRLPADNKMVGIYIMDAIIKAPHEAADEYRRLFDEVLVGLLSKTFKKMDDIYRLPLYACRRTWDSRFPVATLAELDRRLNSIDPAWPVTSAKQEAVPNPLPSQTPKVEQPRVLGKAKRTLPQEGPKRQCLAEPAPPQPEAVDEEMMDASDADVSALVQKLRDLCLEDPAL